MIHNIIVLINFLYNLIKVAMKKLLLFFIAVSTLFGAEVNEANLQDSIQKCNARDKVACREVSRFYGKSASHHNKEATKLWIDYALKGCELRDGDLAIQ